MTPVSTDIKTVAVALNRPVKSYTYAVPPELANDIVIGALVEVPLSSRREIGCIVEINPPGDLLADAIKLKPVVRIVAHGYTLEPAIIDICRWMADYYFCSLGEVLNTASMIGFTDSIYTKRIVYTVSEESWEGLTGKQEEAAKRLTAGSEFESLAAAAKACSASPAITKKLLEAGVLRMKETDPVGIQSLPEPDLRPDLSSEQQAAFNAVEESRSAGEFAVFLLHGVTGSGKTEVYLRLIERAFAAGQSALCLVPEISLTPQTVERFTRRFQEEIGVFHSQLSKSEKRALHEKIRLGRIRLVIGARSATFAPLPRLGVVIIDEEHESSYKQGENPRYHARDVAIMRASRLGVPVVLGSATPSMESYENAIKGKYRLLKLTHRPAGIKMPEVRLVPMGKSSGDVAADLSMLSATLREAVRARLDRGEQSLLFLNRRGFSNFLMCPQCHWVARCEDDDIVLTIHRAKGKREGEEKELELELFPKPLGARDAFLKCHFCGRTHDHPKACPNCEDSELVALGSGTQRVEEHLRRVFPDANILRLDQDAVGGRQAFLKAWHQMVSGEAQIILGTQMIAKGLHLERVTLVGVILADVGLFIPDFRAEERTFSLLMQVAGRAGRTEMGEVLVQTYMPHHAAIQMSSRHDYEGFFTAEMARRRKMRFPPVQKMIALTLSDPDLERAARHARSLAAILRRVSHRVPQPPPMILGPQSAPIERLAGRFRQRLLIRGENARGNAKLLRAALSDREWNPPSSLRLTIDVDPQDML